MRCSTERIRNGCAQLNRKQEVHTNLINLKCMKPVANQYTQFHTHTTSKQTYQMSVTNRQAASQGDRQTERQRTD